MSKNNSSGLKALTRTRQPKFGHYVGEFISPGIGHILSSADCDFCFFDMEHSGFGIETLKQALRYFEAAGIPVFVRSPSKDYDVIARICDAGAEGIMIPMVKDATDAANIVKRMKYPPLGNRGVILGVAHDNFLAGGVPVAERLEQANERTTFFALIETREGSENAEKIAATPGVDSLWLGHFDLSASLGVPGQFDHPDFLAAVERVIHAARKHDLSIGKLAGSVQEGIDNLKQGFDFCCYGTDFGIYQNALISGLAELRSRANDG